MVFLFKKNLKENITFKLHQIFLDIQAEVNTYEIDNNPYYKAGEMIGRQGLEKSYEKDFERVKSVKYFQKDKFNRIIGKYNNGSYDSLLVQQKI